MGVLLVQFAPAAGARVAGAARGGPKLRLIRELGADLAVDYTEPGWDEAVRSATGGRGIDVLWDGAGGEIGRIAFGLVVDGARVSTHGAPGGGFTPVDPAEAERRGITLRGIADVQVTPRAAVPRISRALAAAAAGEIRPVIGRTFPLERAADAHAAIESREVLGKTLPLVRP